MHAPTMAPEARTTAMRFLPVSPNAVGDTLAYLRSDTCARFQGFFWGGSGF
jgi:hypothetical protein